MLIKQNLKSSPKRLGIVAANHTGFIDVMFTCIEDGNIAVPLRGVDDHDRINIAKVEQVIVPDIGESWISRPLNVPKDDAVTLISFTSGTEGNPKGVILTHNNLIEVVTRLNAIMQIDDGISEYIGVPVYHSFGFGRCRAVASVAGRCFIPPNGFNPSEIGEMLKRGEINAISAVPSLWRVLLANKDLIGNSGKKVRWIEIGSQYMSRHEKEELKTLFPNAIIVQHYGLTEASRTTLLEVHQEKDEQLESVGKALNGVEIKITQDERIAIRGKHVAEGYIIDAQEKSIKDEQGWFTTEDLGALENGYLYYRGRADDVINCGGIKVHPDVLESKVYARIGCDHGLAICRKTDTMRGEGFLVAVTKDLDIDKQQLRETVLQTIQELGVNAANAITITDIEALPKTSSGKVQRKKLSEWYDTQHKAETESIDFSTDTPIQKCFCQTLNLRKVEPQDTFISLGGDSLSYVDLSIKLERCLGYLPHGWEKIPLNKLEQLESQQKLQPQRPRFTTMETNILLRALAITGVVINHAGLIPDALISGGAMLLFLIAGINLARFQGGYLLQGRVFQPISSVLWHLLMPYFVIALAYQMYKGDLQLSTFLLFGNFLSPGSGLSIFPTWFIQVLAQSIILFALLFNIKFVRNLGNFCPWRLGLVLLCVAIYLRLLVPYMWDTNYLYNRVPHMMIWMLILGWSIYFAQVQMNRKVITTLILLVVVFAIAGKTFIFTGELPSSSIWIFVGGMLILWQPYVHVPRLLKMVVQTISASAYYIYLTHMIFIHIAKNTMKITIPFFNAIIALIGGILIWFVLQTIQQWFFERRMLSRDDKKFTEQSSI